MLPTRSSSATVTTSTSWSWHLHTPGSHQWSLLNSSQWVSEWVSQWVTDKGKQWSDRGPMKIQKIHHVIIHNNTAIQKCKFRYYRNTKVKYCGQKHKQSCLRMWVKIWSPLDNTKIQKIHYVIIHNNTARQKCKLQYYRNTKIKNCGQKHK